jgi:ankyrin repeat protein
MEVLMKKLLLALALLALASHNPIRAADAGPEPDEKLMNLIIKRARNLKYEPLTIATTYPASVAILKKFIERGEDVTDIYGPNDLLMISRALQNPSDDIRDAVMRNIKVLVDHGLREYAILRGLRDVHNQLKQYAKERLFEAVIAGDYKTVKSLLEGGLVDTKVTIASQRTPLHVAGETGNVHMAELLLEKGADKNARTSEGQSVLDLVISYGHAEKIPQFEKMLSE